MKRASKEIYFNDPQLECMYTSPNTAVIVGGRRLGKSHGFIEPFAKRNTQQMPRSTAGIIGSTYQQLLSRTLPGTLAALEESGFKRDLHYFIGHPPPKSAGFKKPYNNPASFDNTISFYNGTIWRLISQDRPGTSNSLTLDWLIADEAKFLDFNKLKDETFPANGGNKRYFGNNPFHHGMMIVSDMPTTKAGSWFLTYKEETNEEIIQIIQALVYERWKLMERAKLNPKKSDVRRLNQMERDLAKLRSLALYYREWSSIENLALLGDKYIRDMKRDLPPLVFQTSIMCIKPGNHKENFYPALSPEKHYYDSFDNSYLDSLDFKYTDKNNISKQDGDLQSDKPISVAFDYNANINWLVAGQADGSKFRTLKSFYVKYERKIREVVQDFCEYYVSHPTKEVVFYYDSTALNNNYAVDNVGFADTIIHEFERLGWSVTPKYLGQQLKHEEKYRIFHQALSGQTHLFPVFNRPNNEALLLAMENTGISKSSIGFKKDKSGEKYSESEEDLLEHRTDGTDAWDTLFLGATFHPVYSIDSGEVHYISK